MKERVKAFYDEFSKHLLADYVHGNPRTEAAIKHSLSWISKGTKRILDVGCGIGWSTWEIKRNYPYAFVLGIDVSPKACEIAQSLFDDRELSFANNDLTKWSVLLEPPFDAIVMCDVYEHIAWNLRQEVHKVLRKALGQGGRLILTFPSLFHQEFLRKNQPDELQPVDENVDIDDIAKLAQDIEGDVIYYTYVRIWDANDYVHAVIERSPKHSEVSGNGPRAFKTNVELKEQRAKRVVSRLGVRPSRDGVLIPDLEGPVTCVIYPEKLSYSQTFIRAHIERLPGRVKLLYGDWFPTYMEDGSLLLPSGLVHRNMRYASYKLLGLSPQHFKNKALKRFLRMNKVDMVLAEYGPTGVAVMDACLVAGVPFVVHFHGFDAYHKSTLEQFGSGYRRLFSAAAAVIVVSRDMERQLVALGAPVEKVIYSPCGVDTKLFSGATPASAPPVFIAVGRFVDKKAPHLTLLAFKRVVDEYPRARLIMIGDGELWEACKQLARALRISASVEFLGPCSNAEVAAVMQKARAFVQHSLQPSCGDSEGTPVAVLEAEASGLPVVATRHGGIQDVVVDGETGFIVEEGDVDSMGDYMARLVKDPELAARLGRKAQHRILSEFSIDKSIGRLWQILEGSIQGYRKASSH